MKIPTSMTSSHPTLSKRDPRGSGVYIESGRLLPQALGPVRSKWEAGRDSVQASDSDVAQPAKGRR